MSDACEILSFQEPQLKDVLVINPPWLLDQVVGVLLSPAKFPPPRVVYNEHGRENCRRAEESLEEKFAQMRVDEVFTGSATLHMVAEMGICTFDGEDNEDRELVVPSKLKTCRNLQGVLSEQEADTVWFGVQLQCCEVPMSVCLFPQLQVHLYNFFLKKCGQKPRLWSGGLAISLHHYMAIGIVEARPGKMAINIIVRGAMQDLRQSYALLQTLKEETLLKAEAFSPGSDISEKILSSRELSSLDWSNAMSVPQIIYNKADVEEAMKRGGRIGPRGDAQAAAEPAHALMAIPSTHVRLMTSHGYRRFCQKMNRPPKLGETRTKWHELARRLGMPQYEIPARDSGAAMNPTDRIMQWWSRRSGHNTIERLLTEVKAIDHPEAAAVLEREQALFLSILPTQPSPEDSDDSEEETEDVERSATDSAQPEPILDVTLLEIAKCFIDMLDCEQLAVFLRVSGGSDVITSLQSSNPHISPQKAAFEVLKKWRMEKASRATGKVLHGVLKDKLNMGMVAMQLKQELLSG